MSQTAVQLLSLSLGGLAGAGGYLLQSCVRLRKLRADPALDDLHLADVIFTSRFVLLVLAAFVAGVLAAMLAGVNKIADFSIAGLVFAITAGYLASDLLQSLAPRNPQTEPKRGEHDIVRRNAPQPAAPAAQPAVNLSFEEAAPAATPRQHDERAVGMFFATTRAEADEFSEGWFTGERSDKIAFGKAFVRIPEAHRMGKIELPMKIKLLSLELYQATRDPRKHFVVRSVEALTAEKWCDLIGAFPADEALVFVHGFNTSFEEALYRNAQIVWDLQYRGIAVLFSWPSRGHTGDYGYDRNSALGARLAFIEVLKLLKAQSNIKRVHVLAHSMGNLVALDALASHRHDTVPLNLGEVMMAAPDVDSDHFRGIAPLIRKWTAGMTLYASSADKALFASKKLAGSIARAGDVPAEGPILIPDMESIDVTAIGSEILGLNHSTYAQSRSILNDVGVLIRTGTRPPNTRLIEIRGVPEGAPVPKYWRYGE